MRWTRIAAAGATAILIVIVAGLASELWRFGPTDASAAARIESRVRRHFEAMSGTLGDMAERVAVSQAAVTGLPAGDDGARALFDLLRRTRLEQSDNQNIAVTIYDVRGEARAWAGRGSALPNQRIYGPAAFFVTPSSLGLRLVHIRPILAPDGTRLGAAAAEYILSPTPTVPGLTPTDFVLDDPIAPVSLRPQFELGGGNVTAGAFLLRSPAGDPLAEASSERSAIRRARRAWRAMVGGEALAAAAMTLLLLIGPVLDRRAAARDARMFFRCSVLASLLLTVGAAGLWVAFAAAEGASPPVADSVILSGVALASLSALWGAAAARRRLTFRATRRAPADHPGRFVLGQLTAGALVALLLIGMQEFFGWIVRSPSVDLRHFSLHPWDTTRIALLGGILAVQLAAMWTATLTLLAAPAPWRLPRSGWRMPVLTLACWLSAPCFAAAAAFEGLIQVPPLGLLLCGAACATAALHGRSTVTWYRHATAVARILALFLVFLGPALLLYPSIDFLAERAVRTLITDTYDAQARNHVERLQELTKSAMKQIDRNPHLVPFVGDGGAVDAGTTASSTAAFQIWRDTDLNRERLTSAIELYGAAGGLVSRFGLHFPEYSGSAQKPQARAGCEWDLFGEAQLFESDERNMLHAERSICDPSRRVLGTIVVHVMLDYRNLPFISSQSPYFELFRPAQSRAPGEGTAGSDVDVAIYGWGLHPIYTSSRTAWSISDPVFARIYRSRTPFWARIERTDGSYQVYFSNDRFFIYAIGYPVVTLFDHLVHVAELTTLAGVAFLLVVFATAVFTRASRSRPRVGRALLREIRASFYRRLFFAFVLAAVVPVLILALVIRVYFADLLRDAVQSEAARTAAVAQRVIQRRDTLLRCSSELAPGSDDVMVSMSQIIEQDVNIFAGSELCATSERDLFSSGFLATRTPDDVYRAIVLDRLPSFVDEDQIASAPYLIAAAPVRVGDRDAMLTVPLANRRREIERQIDDLDRGVHLAVLCFVLLGAAIGLWLAERIADPVRRLTRATRRIAAGDFDAQIAVRSADELKRLVDSFNSMASELKAQRTQLERTHRLEAWAEMARQVAHEIKNPLTPIQLSAEHLLRVHADRGEPLGPVLESCVVSILGQVRLLRQISSDFSSFAASPTARRAAVALPLLVADVVDPYRTGLAGRIDIDNRVQGPLSDIVVDRTLIARALSNLVENALYAMPDGGRLTLRAHATGDAVVLEVTDTGVGMDADALSRVFEPYFSTKTTGTGLGLPIARRNIELSGGTVEVESEPGQGTTVRVRLPTA